jgi:hypothetical protein
VRIATVPGATCTVTAAAGRKSAILANRKAAVGGRLDTAVTAATLRTQLGAAVGSTAQVTARCSVGSGKNVRNLPAAVISVRFT